MKLGYRPSFCEKILFAPIHPPRSPILSFITVHSARRPNSCAGQPIDAAAVRGPATQRRCATAHTLSCGAKTAHDPTAHSAGPKGISRTARCEPKSPLVPQASSVVHRDPMVVRADQGTKPPAGCLPNPSFHFLCPFFLTSRGASAAHGDPPSRPERRTAAPPQPLAGTILLSLSLMSQQRKRPFLSPSRRSSGDNDHPKKEWRRRLPVAA